LRVGVTSAAGRLRLRLPLEVFARRAAIAVATFFPLGFGPEELLEVSVLVGLWLPA